MATSNSYETEVSPPEETLHHISIDRQLPGGSDGATGLKVGNESNFACWCENLGNIGGHENRE